MPSPLDFLPKNELLLLIEIMNRLAVCSSCEVYREIFDNLKSLIPYDYATSGLVSVNDHGAVEAYDLVNINFTEDWMAAYDEQRMYLIDVTVQENFKYYKTQCWSETYKKYENPKKLLSFAHDFNLMNGYSCGAKSFGLYKKPSMISFVWNFNKRDMHISSIIEYLTPHMHIALSNVIYTKNLKVQKFVLTEREVEVVSWIKEGKSSWDIACILKISEATVNYHVTNIMKKLNAYNRAQAVAVALQHGIIKFD
jgi:DNA-binding CsgD family transcriptional regulator